MKPNYIGLVGDVGGTNARFALVDGEGAIRNPRTFEAKAYGSLVAVMEEYLNTTAGKRRPPRASTSPRRARARRRWRSSSAFAARLPRQRRCGRGAPGRGCRRCGCMRWRMMTRMMTRRRGAKC